MEVDDFLNHLLESGQGCNLTLINHKPIREVDAEDEDDYGGFGHMGISSMNNSGSSFMQNTNSKKDKDKHSTQSNNASKTRASSQTKVTPASDRQTGGDNNQCMESTIPVWMNAWFFVVLSMLGLGWILRLIIY